MPLARGWTALRHARPIVGLLALALYALAFQGTRHLWEPDEGRYTAVAVQMLRSGSFLTPALNHENPHLTKPPLTYWLLAASVALFGPNEWATRLPNTLAYLATALLVWLIAARLLPGRGALATVIFCSLLFPFMAANVVTTDTLLTAWETAAVAAFCAWWADPPDGRRGWPIVAMWAAFGAAFLTKGLPALLPLLAIAAIVAVTDSRRDLRRLVDVRGLLAFSVIGLSWFVVIIAHRPQALHYFLADELVARVASDVFHRNPEWYGGLKVYGPVLLAGTMPWTVSLFRRLPRVLRPAWWRDKTAHEPTVVFLMLWFLLPLAVFMVVRSRLPFYVLPLFPPLALLLARAAPAGFALRRVPLALLTAWFVLLVTGRAVLSSVPLGRDSRVLADAIAGTMPAIPAEVVFVDVRPFRGVSFYLETEVEPVLTTRPGTVLVETVTQEMADVDELAMERVFVVGADRLEALRQTMAAANWKFGCVARWGEYAFAEVPPRERQGAAVGPASGRREPGPRDLP
jgi:4-amino-4-deoxy-L-arabinose transferase